MPNRYGELTDEEVFGPAARSRGVGLFDDIPMVRATPRRPGLFDDLIPGRELTDEEVFGPQGPVGAQPATPGMFDDIPMAEQPAAPGMFDDLIPKGPQGAQRSLTVGAQGVGRGLADIAGAPVDLLTAAMNGALRLPGAIANVPIGLARLATGYDVPYVPQAPQIENPVGGSDWIAEQAGRGVEAAGLPLVDKDDMSGGERLAHNVSRFGTGAGQGAMAAMRAFKGAAAPLIRALAQPYADDAARGGSGLVPLATDAAAGMGAGVGADVVEDSDSAIAKLLAPIVGAGAAGGAVAAVTAPARVARTVRYYGGTDNTLPYSAGQPSPFVADQARKHLQHNAVDPNAAAVNMRAGAAAYADANMPAPSSGILSGDEGLIGVERALRRRPGSQSDVETSVGTLLARRDSEVQAAASDKVHSIGPAEPSDPRAPVDFARRTIDDRMAAATGRETTARGALEQAQQAEQQLGQPIRAASADAGPASQALDNLIVERTLRPMQSEMRRSANAIDPDGTVMRPTMELERAVEDIEERVGQLTPRSYVVPEALVQRIRTHFPQEDGTGGQVPLRAMQELREQIGGEITKARKAGDIGIADSLQRVRQALNDDLAALAGENSPEGLQARQHLDRYRDEFAPLFGRGEGRNLRRDVNADDLYRSNTPPTATAQRFVRTGAGSREAAADLKRILDASPDPRAGQREVRRYLTASLSRAVDEDGTINARRLSTWADAHEGVLSQFPSLRNEVNALRRAVVNRRDTTSRLQQELVDAANAARAERADIDQSALSLMLGQDPENAVRRVFGSGDPERSMETIVRELRGDQAAARGWKRAVSDHLHQRVTNAAAENVTDGSRNVSLAKLSNLLQRHDATLAKLYSPAEMRALQEARRAVRDLSRRSLSAGGPGTTTAEDLARLLQMSEVTLMGLYGHIRGRGMAKTLKMAVGLVPGLNAEGAAANLIERAMFDPELAAKLLTTPTSKPDKLQWSKDVARLLGVEAGAREANDTDEE